MSDERKQQNNGYQPSEKGYQPQSDSTLPPAESGYVPVNSGGQTHDTAEPPGEE